MPTYIIKPERETDLYVWWSTIVDAPVGWGDRADALAHGTAEDRLERADRTGTSANWTNWPAEKMPYRYDDGEPMILREQDDLDESEGCWLLPRANLLEFVKRRDAGEPIDDLVTFERYDDED